MSEVVRERPEIEYAIELSELAKADTLPRPPRWRLSPQAVAIYLLGDSPERAGPSRQSILDHAG
jgi:hypothetical protein